MEEKKSIPTALTIVAVLFILGGISSVIEIIISLMNNHINIHFINIHFGILGLFIGPGLLKLSRGWRTCALVFTWIAIIGLPIITLFIIPFQGPLDLEIFGQPVGHVSKGFGLLMAGVIFIIAFWQYRVLTRPDIKKLFGIERYV